jgi:4a-hydroxytetrahydrobiopterin dehydratase
MMSALTPDEVWERLRTLPRWKLEGEEIIREFSFADFVTAIGFVNRVAEQAEKAGHHPDIDIRYNKVRLALVTHDQGGLTEQDMKLASVVDTLV